jgi:hypothetical protein
VPMYPVVFTYPARIDHMGQIVLGVRHNKIGVRDRVVAVTGSCFVRRRNPGCRHTLTGYWGRQYFCQQKAGLRCVGARN